MPNQHQQVPLGDSPPIPTGEHPVTNGELKREFRWQDLKILGGMVLTIFIGGWATLAAVNAQAETVVQEKTEVIKDRMKVQSDRIDDHVRESGAIHSRQDRMIERTEAKVDRVSHMVEEMREMAYRDRGMRPPPLPPVGSDGGQ